MVEDAHPISQTPATASVICTRSGSVPLCSSSTFSWTSYRPETTMGIGTLSEKARCPSVRSSGHGSPSIAAGKVTELLTASEPSGPLRSITNSCDPSARSREKRPATKTSTGSFDATATADIPALAAVIVASLSARAHSAKNTKSILIDIVDTISNGRLARVQMPRPVTAK